MAPAPGVHIPLRYLRTLIKKGASILRNRIAEKSSNTRTLLSETQLHYEPAYARVAQRNGAHPLYQRIKVARRWYTTQFNGYLNGAGHGAAGSAAARAGHEASRYPASKVASAVSRLTTSSPFAHTLRPKLTGGALPRTASGYSLGNGAVNGARYFSHCNPAAPAQVFAQVTAGVRAFLLNGKDEMEQVMKNRKSGIRGGVWANVSEKKTRQQTCTAPKGSFVDFNIAPTITCLSPLAAGKKFASSTTSLETPGFMEDLSADFTTIMSDLTITLSDIQRIKSSLGDLPIALVTNRSKISLRIYFPDRDPEYVERLCEEAGVMRGIVGTFGEEHEPDSHHLEKTQPFELLMPTLILPNRNLTPVWGEPVTAYNSGEMHWNDMLSGSSTSETYPASAYSELEEGAFHSDIFEQESVDVENEEWSSPENSSGWGYQQERLAEYDVHGVQRFLEEVEEYRTVRNPWRGEEVRY